MPRCLVIGLTLLPSDYVSRGGHPAVMLDYRYWPLLAGIAVLAVAGSQPILPDAADPGSGNA